MQLTETFLYASTTSDSASTTATAGEKTHTLSVNEIPSHHHVMGYSWSTGSGSSSGYAKSSSRAVTSANTDNTGGGQAHNNMPPYMRVYMWKRTA